MKQNLRQDLQAIQQQLMAGRFQEGVRLCRQVLSYAPNEPNALYMMGVAAAQLGDANGHLPGCQLFLPRQTGTWAGTWAFFSPGCQLFLRDAQTCSSPSPT